jgi:hypothetical protein
MTLKVILLGVFVGTVAPQSVRINDVPRTVDPAFSTRTSLCPSASYEGGVIRSNDSRTRVGELLGRIRSVEIHQFGSRFSNVSQVEEYVRGLVTQRPRQVFRYQPRANPTPLDAGGVLGTFRFADGISGVFEATGPYVCVQDSMSRHWWLRLAPDDVW